jgi:hypothetical protein
MCPTKRDLVVKAYWAESVCRVLFRAETYRLNINVCSRDLVDETTLSDVGVTTDQECSRVGVDGWQTTNMLSDLLEVRQRVLLSPHDGGHTTQSGLLELLASVKRVSKLEQTDIVLGYLLDQVTCGG